MRRGDGRVEEMRKQEQERGASKEGWKGMMKKKRVEERRTEGKDEKGERK